MMAPLAYTLHVGRDTDMPRLRDASAVVAAPADHILLGQVDIVTDHVHD